MARGCDAVRGTPSSAFLRIVRGKSSSPTSGDSGFNRSPLADVDEGRLGSGEEHWGSSGPSAQLKGTLPPGLTSGLQRK